MGWVRSQTRWLVVNFELKYSSLDPQIYIIVIILLKFKTYKLERSIVLVLITEFTESHFLHQFVIVIVKTGNPMVGGAAFMGVDRNYNILNRFRYLYKIPHTNKH